MRYKRREVVGAFDDEKALDAAVRELEEERGFEPDRFSLLASEDAVEKKLGNRYQQVRDVEDLPNVPREAFFSRFSRLGDEFLAVPVLASVGALLFVGVSPVPTVVVAAGAGAALGLALGQVAHQRHVAQVQEQLARGGLVLWIHVTGAHQEKTALEVLRAHSARDVHAHDIAD